MLHVITKANVYNGFSLQVTKSGYTIAKELAKHGYIICDNQLINYPIFPDFVTCNKKSL